VLLHYLGKQKAENACFHLNANCCFDNKHTKRIHIINWSQLNHPSFSQESDVCIKQDLGRENSVLPSLTTHSSFTKSAMTSVAVPIVGVVLSRASSEKSMDSIGGISYYLKKC